MVAKLGGRKMFLTYLIMSVICATYIYMISKSQVNAGDFSTFCTALVSLGIGYGGVNAAHKLADKNK